MRGLSRGSGASCPVVWLPLVLHLLLAALLLAGPVA